MASDAPEKTPWDRRLAERLARGSWEAANDPARRRQNPPFREQIRSPYSWLAILLAFGGAILIWRSTKLEWMQALGVVLYLLGFVANAVARRDALAAGTSRGTTDEKATK